MGLSSVIPIVCSCPPILFTFCRKHWGALWGSSVFWLHCQISINVGISTLSKSHNLLCGLISPPAKWIQYLTVFVGHCEMARCKVLQEFQVFYCPSQSALQNLCAIGHFKNGPSSLIRHILFDYTLLSLREPFLKPPSFNRGGCCSIPLCCDLLSTCWGGWNSWVLIEIA